MTEPLEKWLNEGIEHHQALRYQDAEDCYKKILAVDPRNADANHLMGVMALQLDQFDVAVQILRQAVELSPKAPRFHYNLGLALTGQGEPEEALKAYRRTLNLDPDFADTYNNMGFIYQGKGDLDQALACFRKASKLDPDAVAPKTNVGAALVLLKRYDEAEQILTDVISSPSPLPDAYYNLAYSKQKLGRFDDAIALYRELLDVAPDHSGGHNNLGLCLRNVGVYDEAGEHYKKAFALAPDNISAAINLAEYYMEQGLLDGCVDTCKIGLIHNPNDADLLSEMSLAELYLGHPIKALNLAREACAIDTSDPNTLGNLGLIELDLAMLEDGVSHLKQAVSKDSARVMFYSGLMYACAYAPFLSMDEIFDIHVNWPVNDIEPGDARTRAHRNWTNNRDPNRPLKIGYLSSDFRNHAAYSFIRSLIEHHDRSNVSVIAYSNTRNTDYMTDEAKSYVDKWVNIFSVSDKTVIQQIRADEIDILIELNGHTAGGRQKLLLERAAPIQISYLGYCYTTGLEGVDYLLTDNRLTPEGSDQYFTEELLRLPDTFLCYSPLAAARGRDVATSPADRNGYVTFGYLGRTIRLHDDVLDTWAEILRRIPTARLLLDNKPFADKETHQYFCEKFKSRGIDLDRVEAGYTYPVWPAYDRIDIALDPFPHNGGTTTCEALWLGCPTLSVRDRAPMGRFGDSILNAAGLPDWIAEDKEDYIEKAVQHAADIEKLAALRSTMRDRLSQSPLMDGTSFARNVEAIYRNIWQSWCAEDQQDDTPVK